jgi:hypothetical protein
MTSPIIMWRLSRGEINPVECTKVTACYVWRASNGRSGACGESRDSTWHSYHETWAGAHQAALAEAENKLARCRRDLERAQGDHGRIKGMKPPADAEVQP